MMLDINHLQPVYVARGWGRSGVNARDLRRSAVTVAASPYDRSMDHDLDRKALVDERAATSALIELSLIHI